MKQWSFFPLYCKSIHLTVCFYHVMYAFQSESTLCSCLNVKELLAWSRREIWNLSDCNWIRTHNHLVYKCTVNHLVHKGTLNHLASLAKWLSVCLWTKWLSVRVQLQSLTHVRECQQLGFVTLNSNLAVSGWVGLAYDH